MCPIYTEVMVKVHVVDLKSENIAPPVSVRAYLNQTITEFKQLISQVVFDSLVHDSHLPLLTLVVSCGSKLSHYHVDPWEKNTLNYCFPNLHFYHDPLIKKCDTLLMFC